jgi:hypothetical protein
MTCCAIEGWYWWGSTHLGISALRNWREKGEKPRNGYGPIHKRSHRKSDGREKKKA